MIDKLPPQPEPQPCQAQVIGPRFRDGWRKCSKRALFGKPLCREHELFAQTEIRT